MKISRFQIAKRTLLLRCPNCGNRSLFKKWYRMSLLCENCHLPLAQRQGFYLGAMCINYGICVFFVLPLLLIMTLNGWISAPTSIVTGVALAVGCPVISYRLSWGVWLFLYYMALPHELPANHTELIPIEEDEMLM